jgi:hypothetical protein
MGFMRTERVAVILVVVAIGAVIWTCPREPDLKQCSTAELVPLVAGGREDSPADSLSSRAAVELRSRPEGTVVADLISMVRDGTPDTQRSATKMLDMLMARDSSNLPSELRQAADAALFANLTAKDGQVRAAALTTWSFARTLTRPASVPETVLTAVHELLASDIVQVRREAAISAFWIGPALASLAPILTTGLQTEADDGVRFALASALGTVAADHAPAQAALTAALDDASETVRYATATSLGRFLTLDAASLDGLYRCLTNAAEEPGIRVATAESLAKHAKDPELAARVLLVVLDSRSVFSDYEQQLWLTSLGTLAARAPSSAAASAARTPLEAAMQDKDEDLQAIAASSLARIACAERDRPLAERVAGHLIATIPRLTDASQQQGDWTSTHDVYERSVEAILDLSRWPELQVDAEPLRPILKSLQQHKYWWVRDWATEQFRRLP